MAMSVSPSYSVSGLSPGITASATVQRISGTASSMISIRASSISEFATMAGAFQRRVRVASFNWRRRQMRTRQVAMAGVSRPSLHPAAPTTSTSGRLLPATSTRLARTSTRAPTRGSIRSALLVPPTCSSPVARVSL